MSARPAARSWLQRLPALVLTVTVVVSSNLAAAACVGRRGNNDGPRIPGEENPAQPESHRRQIEEDR